MRTYALVADLPFQLESYRLEGLERPVTGGWTRLTTVIRLAGGGEEGLGEDVTYAADEQRAFRAAGAALPLAGSHSVSSFSGLLEALELSDFRRWAFESAALDLALRRAGRSLADALGRQSGPLRFVVSPRLGEPPTAEPVERLLALHPGTRFKLDPKGDWDEALIGRLAALEAVEVCDFKAFYDGARIDAGLYRRVAEGFPRAWLEDPLLDQETEEALRPHRDRITWDAPIHSVADIAAREPLAIVNIKPSRFGSLERLLDAYDHCAERGIAMYGGGQFELGPGRGQIQYLASLFHPDGPNDVAPGGYNNPMPGLDLPAGPLRPAPEPAGFHWA